MAPFIRIALRYLAGYFLARGWITDQSLFSDPEIVSSINFGLAALFGLVSEGWWYLAHKYGWAK